MLFSAAGAALTATSVARDALMMRRSSIAAAPVLFDRQSIAARSRPCHSIVIPGRRAAASPGSINTVRGYGFRTRAFGAIRNDDGVAYFL
jgi:hypothetical protein